MPSDETKAYLYAGGAVLLWSTVATAFKLALTFFAPAQLLCIAVCTACACLLPLCACTGRFAVIARLSRKETLWCLGLGVLTPFLYYSTLFEAYALLPAQVAQPINYTWAMMLMFLSVPLLGHRVLPLEWLAAVISYAGVVVIVSGGGAGDGGISLKGLALIFVGTAFWALFWIGNTRLKVDPLAALTLNFLAALPCCLIFMWFVAPLKGEMFAEVFSGGFGDFTAVRPPMALTAALYAGVVEMAAAFYLWLKAMHLAPSAGRIAPLIYFSPFLSLVFIGTIVGEAIHPGTLAGLGCIIAGCLIQRFALRRSKAAE